MLTMTNVNDIRKLYFEEGKTKELGFDSVIVLGHKDYYPRFGFKKASKWNIKCCFEVPDEVFMAVELIDGALKGKEGTIKYPDEFMDVE